MPSPTTDGLSALISRSLAAEYTRVKTRVHALVDPLTNEQLWRRPFPYGNSVGHLLLHLTGNLSYYIGTQVAGTGYVRDRPKEFADTSQRAKAEVLRDFDRAMDMVLATVAAQGEADWHAPYSGTGTSESDRLAIFLHCVTHADHHTGQIIYLCKQLGLGAAPAP